MEGLSVDGKEVGGMRKMSRHGRRKKEDGMNMRDE
jgi:hypothetical protein